jgi:hypothetical protein
MPTVAGGPSPARHEVVTAMGSQAQARSFLKLTNVRVEIRRCRSLEHFGLMMTSITTVWPDDSL